MASDLTVSTDVTVPARTHRRRGALLVAVAVFQLWLWGTRIANLLAEDASFSAAFVAVHGVLYTVAIGVAVVLGVLGARMFSEARRRVRP